MSNPSAQTYQEYREGIERLQNTKGWLISKRIEHLGVSGYIFEANYRELMNSIQYFKSDAAMDLWDYRNVDKMGNYLKEITRMLHNFVASARTLVDHTRIIARELYVSQPFLDEYQSQVDRRLLSNPTVQFVHDLRNFILHYDLPVTFASLTPDHEQLLKISILALRKWSGWKAVSRQYLSSAGDEQNVEDVVEEYTKAILAFHGWFSNRQLDLHKKEFSEAEELRRSLVSSRWHLPITRKS
jgi:hypothetical protein